MSSSTIRQLDEDLRSRFGVGLIELVGRKPSVEVVTTEKADILLVDGRPALLQIEGELIPALSFEKLLAHLPKVVVDSGAVPHICNGADVMAPGVVKVSASFEGGAVVVVAEERYGKAIALGVALRGSREIMETRKGRVVRNVHYVGDRIWKALRELA